MNRELLKEAVELDKHISQLKDHLQEVKFWANKESVGISDKNIRILPRSEAPDSPHLREEYLCIAPQVIVSTYISALESEIEELKNKFNNL